ncbi:MAG TPA: phosphoethanolamine--lipid A transferase [Burkholderiales bacterium]|nr:phosphoethanolamine--lipid A transferase [Burkholderiales bacterium]
MLLHRIAVGHTMLTLLASLWLTALGNLPFWRSVWRAAGGVRPDNFLFLLTLPLAVLAWSYLLLSAIAWGRATRALLGAVLLASAAAGYFTHAYGTLFDAGMIVNVAQTHAAEVRELLDWRLALWVAFFGALPAGLLARVRVAAASWRRELGAKAAGMAAAGACLAGLLLANYAHYASLLRNHRELRLMLVPHNIAAAGYGYLKRWRAVGAAPQPVGLDAVRSSAAALAPRPMLVVLMVGETARAQNFSLNGYPRPTNPALAREDVLSFTEVASCGTSTAVSLPCMFLDVGRAGFDDSLALRRESLLDVLQRAGIAVLWRDNNSGCKGVCDRVPHENLAGLRVAGLCQDGECHDEILLHGLQEILDRLDRDALVVLHMKGSHGPAYYRRYPKAFEVFKPACETAQLDRCSREAIVNAYDNTLRYTDHVLARTIELLRANARRFDTAMLYVSDHGESLGENGLYLHGIPYALAPREQTRIPMLLWLSQELRRRAALDPACLEARRHEPLSHDHLFHSVLGLMEVRTAVYRPERDLFRGCRALRSAVHGGTG